MKIGAYSPHNGQLLAETVSGLNFGNVRQDEHCVLPVVVRPLLEDETAVSLELFLQNDGGFTQTRFGYRVSTDFLCDLAPGVDLSDHFNLTSDPPQPGGVPIAIDVDGYGDYVWLDVQAGASETGGTSSINYRFIFEYV
jgi:hypothetical protein